MGQVFVPQRSPLQRLDFKVDNRSDPRPGRVQLYQWRGSYGGSISQAPLSEHVLQLSGNVGFQIRSIFPRSDVEPGAPLLILFRSEGREEYALQHSPGDTDRYPAGRIVPIWRPNRATWDLWFRSYSGPRAVSSPMDPALEPSDPALPWDAPPATQTGVERDHYLARVRAHVEARRSALAADCGDNLRQSALTEALLHRASCERGSCDERHEEALRTLFHNAYAWRFCAPRPDGGACDPACDPNPDLRFGWLQPAALSYLWTRESPAYRLDDHVRIRALLLDSAERLWPKREIGVHNRSLRLAVSYLALSMLYTDHPDADAWRRYAGGVWDEFWEAKDTLEDSAQYTGIIGLPSILEYADLSDFDDRLWSDPGFLALVDRFAERIAPLGADPNFGDGVGWARDSGGLIWLFEKMAARTRNPRYRWLAARLFHYNAARALEVRPRHDSLAESLPWLARAWLDADDSIEALPPPARREVPVALQTQQGPVGGQGWQVDPGRPLGQTFRADATPLVRLVLKARSRGAAGSALLSLWKWRLGRDATVAEPPLYRERFALDESSLWTLLTAFPLLEAEVGGVYYLEIEAEDTPFLVAGTEGSSDPYPPGTLLVGGSPVAADLWFRVNTLSEGGSVVTRRREVTPVAREDWGEAPIRRHAFGEEQVPNKLVLRSGFEPDDLHVVVNLLRGYPHGQEELGAVVSMTDGGSVLIADTPFPYWNHGRLPEDESAPQLRRYWGGLPVPAARHAEVTHFADARNATVAWLEWNDVRGWGVQQERRLYFVKNRFLLVRDRFTFPLAMGAAAGPVWHAGDVHPVRAESWFDTYYREPLSNRWKLRNPERYALLFFVPRLGRRVAAFREPTYLPPEGCPERVEAGKVEIDCRSGPPYVVYQRWTGEVGAGESRWFDTLVLPHGPELPPHAAAAGVRVLRAGTESVALEVRMGAETWTLVDNPSGAPLEVEGVATDARYAILRAAPLRPPYLLAHEVTYVEAAADGRDWPFPTSVELGGTLPVRRLVP